MVHPPVRDVAEAKRDDHPWSLRAKGTSDERLVSKDPQHTLDVVLHVLPMIDEVRIGPSVRGREKNVHAPARRRITEPRSDRGIVSAPAKQRPIELHDESHPEPFHERDACPPFVPVLRRVDQRDHHARDDDEQRCGPPENAKVDRRLLRHDARLHDHSGRGSDHLVSRRRGRGQPLGRDTHLPSRLDIGVLRLRYEGRFRRVDDLKPWLVAVVRVPGEAQGQARRCITRPDPVAGQPARAKLARGAGGGRGRRVGGRGGGGHREDERQG